MAAMPGWPVSEQLVKFPSTVKAALVGDFGLGLAMTVIGGAGGVAVGSQNMASAVPSIMCWTAVPPMTGWW